MQVIPCGHRIVVRPERLTDVDPVYKSANAAGIYLIDQAKKTEQAAVDKGTVVSIGPTAFKDFGGEAWCKVGDKVAFAKYGGKFVDDTTLILNDEDIVCVIKEAA
jgi:co-chaperonin GroES (HSP10)